MWVVPWIESVFLPSKPSRYSIHNNAFLTTAPGATGVLLFSDTPDDPWIDAIIWNNSIQLQESPSDGIDAVHTKGTVILKNKVTGSGWDAVYMAAHRAHSCLTTSAASRLTPARGARRKFISTPEPAVTLSCAGNPLTQSSIKAQTTF